MAGRLHTGRSRLLPRDGQTLGPGRPGSVRPLRITLAILLGAASAPGLVDGRQILCTTRQRKRLEYAVQSTERLEVPDDVAAIAANNPHLHYIVEHLAALAFTLFARPSGLAFAQMCLLSSDVPVVLCNAPDADDQLAAAAHADILLPLDPHRLLFLPGTGMRARDPRKRTDHRSLIPGGVGMALVQVAYDVPAPSSPTTPGTTPGATGGLPGHATPPPGTETASRRRPTPSSRTYWLSI